MRSSRGCSRRWGTRARRLTVLGSPLVLLLLLSGACNALTGEHDRFLDDDDGDAGRPDRIQPSTDASDDTNPPDEEVPDAGEDATLTITIGARWTTPNGARWQVDGGATTIIGFDATHPIIVPAPQPQIPSDDYTVTATVLAPGNGEFGILARIQPSDGSAVLFSSKYGADNFPWLGTFGPPEWNPTRLANGASYTFTPTRYRLWLNVQGNVARGKLWEASKPEPTVQVTAEIPWTTGRGVGFYTYGTGAGAVLEKLEVTVP